MTSALNRPRVSEIRPSWALPGARVTIEGTDLVSDRSRLPTVTVGHQPARIVTASPLACTILVPAGVDVTHAPVRVEGALGETAFIDIGAPVATGLHQVDSPAIDPEGAMYVTYSGSRGEESPVSLFRVRRDGFREPFVTGITNATSTAFSPDGRLYVSSRFAGTVYRVEPDGAFEPVVSDLGVACGLAFSPDGTMYVGDRSGTVFRVGTAGHATAFATLPSSVAAFHLAWGPDDAVYVTAPTLSSRDAVYRLDHTGSVDVLCSSFGRPQGLAFDADGRLHVVEALAGAGGLYQVDESGMATRVLAGRAVGVAFDPTGGLIVVSSDTAYRFDLPVTPFTR